MLDEAIVLVGGMGTRLRAALPDTPKPLAPVAGRPFLAWVLDELVNGGITRLILATGHGAASIRDTIGESWQGVDVVYSQEDEPLGTGGALKLAIAHSSGGGVHLVNGDTYLEYSPASLREQASSLGVDAAVALARVPDVGRYGAVDVREGLVHSFHEKGQQGPGLINAGCYFLGPGVLGNLPGIDAFSFERDVLPVLAQERRLAGYAEADRFIDIGIPEDYAKAQTWFAT